MIRKTTHVIVTHTTTKASGIRQADKVQKAANVVADRLDPATFLFPMLSMLGIVIGVTVVFIAFGLIGLILLARLIKIDIDEEEDAVKAAARRCVKCLKSISETVLLKIETTGKALNGISPERATRELDRRDPRHS